MAPTFMRILLLHNFYGSSAPSGENQVFEAEREMLLQRGNDVELFIRHSDEIRHQGTWGSVQGALATPWNPWMFRALRQTVASIRPDVVHVHNTFPLLSPAIFHAIGHRPAKVLTLHNYRLFCPAAIPMRDGKVCTECMERHTVWPGLRHGCYRKSRLATLPLAASVALHRGLGTWSRKVDGFITLTEFQRLQMIAAGLPAELVSVKPNFYPGSPTIVPWQERRSCVVFAGRLTEEKGIRTLVRAWLDWGERAPELRMVGDGPLRRELEQLAANHPKVPIHFLGQLNAQDAQSEIAYSRLLVLPSECFEGFPMVVREAFAFGTPAAVSNIGPLPSIVQDGCNGVVFQPGNSQSLVQVLQQSWNTPGTLERLAEGARASFESLYTEEVNYRILLDIYRKAVERSKIKFEV